MYLVPVWALFSSVRSRMGWALVSSRVSPSGLSGALLPWSSSFWRCQITRICGPPVVPLSLEAVLDRALTPDPVACVVVAEGLLDLRTFFEPWVRCGRGLWLVAGGRMMRMPGPGGAVVVVGGRMTRMLGLGSSGGSGGMRGVGRLLLFRLGWGRGAPFCRLVRLGGTGGGGAGGAWGWKKGCVACWSESLSGGSAGVCIFRFRVAAYDVGELAYRSPGDLLAMAVQRGCRRRGGVGGSSSWPWPA